MSHYKIYGEQKTNLVLSEKAEKAYSVTKPLTIIEHSDGYYSIRGAADRDDLTAEDVNRLLEDLYDKVLKQAEEA